MSSDSSGPYNNAQSLTSSAVSLEQLLSMRQPAASRMEAVNPDVDAALASKAVGRTGSGADVPVIWVIHEEQLFGSSAKAKLQGVASEVHLQWMPMQASFMEHMHAAQPDAVVIQFESEVLEAAAEAAKLLQQKRPHLPIFALGNTRDSRSMLFALRSGVQDFLDMNATDQDMHQGFQELLAKSRTREKSHVPPASAPLTAILSARAGAGSSLLAAHLAVFLQQALLEGRKASGGAGAKEALSTLLLDLGAPAGDGALYLDLVSEFDFVEAVHSLHRFDQRMASAGLAQHDSGLRLLSLPRQSALMREVAYMEADLLVQRLREYFQYIVADLGGVSQTHVALRVASQASRIWVVCDQSLPSVVSTTELLRQLELQQVPRSGMELIVCRHDRNLELSAQHIADQLQIPLLMTIPERRMELLQVVNQGQLLSPQTRREPYVQAVHKLVDLLLHQEGLTSTSKPGVMSSLLQRMRGG